MITRLVRTNRGKMIHREDCGQLARCKLYPPVPWNWADDKNEQIIRVAIMQFHYTVCVRCQPVRPIR